MRYIILIFLVFLVGCIPEKPLVKTSLEDTIFLPQPNEVSIEEYGFLFDNRTVLYSGTSPEIRDIANEFRALITKNTSFPFALSENITSRNNAVLFEIVNADSIPNSEGYILEVIPERVSLQASKPEGLYRGMQTLIQMLPDDFINYGASLDSLVLPGTIIKDAPSYEYRGMMLDVARHFIAVDDLKKVIDDIATYKINKLHLHLSDDQGWRIEIKSWPKLTEIGGSTEVGGGTGGFYTQEEYKDIVAYAAAHFIEIIPEIDMPGHTNAALASYPELNCDDKATELYTGMRVGFSSLCVDKERTYQFIEDVVREISALTPGNYFHIGGDESHATSAADYKKFLQKVYPIVKRYRKKIIGWEDISNAGVDSTMIIQHWTSESIATKGLSQGAKVIISPASEMYLDIKYTKDSRIGLTWAGLTEVDKAYSVRPLELFPDVPKDQILGLESPLWSETVTNLDDLQYLAFPRLIGHAEIGWTDEEHLDWQHYKYRLSKHDDRLKYKGINSYTSPLIHQVD